MNSVRKNRKEFVAGLGSENREFYGSPDGRGMLRRLELTFDQRWDYLYELVQNALDAGASSISIRLAEAGNSLIFQHNGDIPLDEKDVEGLSKIFRSTKGARSVGFMGIGFKSIFSRFQEARVSGWGWTFRYNTTQTVGEEYGDVQRDLLGSVVPVWDHEITEPEDGFTTRYEAHRRIGRQLLSDDLMRFLPDNDRTSLAILAMSGLKRLEIDGWIWKLEVSERPDESFEATALSESEKENWRIFRVRFQPSRDAIACFLEHRRIQVYSDPALPRQVLGVLPLDNDGLPAPPTRGHVYATLPTGVTLPFGLHVNADWLLDISRSDLRRIEDNLWQRGIVDAIADVLARFLQWSANAHFELDAARAAFKVLAQPLSEAGGLESLLAEERWLERLRDRIKDVAVLPVWTETTGKLAYARSRDILVPPESLSKAFRDQPEVRPTVLLKGRVFMDHILGSKAIGLLRRVGLLTEMTPHELEQVWDSGLEDWWVTLPEEQGDRRRLLFRIWAAVAELASKEAWRNLNARCVRSVTGEWVAVSEATFLNEALAAEEEPGGRQTRQFMQRFIKDANRLDSEWVNALRGGSRQERDRMLLSQAWGWIEGHARSISLQEIIKNALDALTSSTDPDWSVLVPFGHWAKHRNRADLLTHVLVQSDGDQLGVLVKEALLADPYVDHGGDRRRLFSGLPTIAGVYMKTDPESAGPHEWRTFFEKAGAKGGVKMKESKETARRSEHSKVAEFLGCNVGDIPWSNNAGYTLSDFDVEPSLPSVGASRELRTALAPWLEDGYRFLKGKGKRKVSGSYYRGFNVPGNKPSTWVKQLSSLEWVPCDDGKLRKPKDVLKDYDPARQDAPFAKLSSQFVSVLEQEGVRFGTTIPEAPSLRRLSVVGSRLNAEELAGLLAECREQVTKDLDRKRFDQALQELRLPTNDNQRVTLDRIVQRIGGHLRGTLGGWIVPLDRIEEILRMGLEHPDFPHKFPETTTGYQALDYVQDVWGRARTSPEGLANEVRDVLPVAYAYCLDDCAEDALLMERWQSTVSQAMLFADRKWIALTNAADIYLDDIDDRRFFPRQVQIRTVTGGHLGRSHHEQVRTAKKICLPLLSSRVTLDWSDGNEKLSVPNDWISRFEWICKLLRQERGSESLEEDGAKEPDLIRVRELVLDVGFGNHPIERVPVNARLHQGTLTVAGKPLQFGADAAKELLRHFSFGQRGDLSADLTGMLMTIDNDDFILAADKFRRSHAPEFELPAPSERDSGNGGLVGSEDESDEVDAIPEPIMVKTAGRVPLEDRTPISAASENPYSTRPTASAKAEDIVAATSNKAGHGVGGSTGGSYTRDRALAKQNSLARRLKSSLKGEIVPDFEAGDPGEIATINGNTDKSLDDEEYREIVAQYEKDEGREPELGDPHQSGWDIRSIDPRTQEVRFIEVKGRGRPWDGVEVVELSGAQVRKAFEATESWYLYVVEKTVDGGYRVLPIANPVHAAAKWILCGESWRMAAEDARVVANPP